MSNKIAVNDAQRINQTSGEFEYYTPQFIIEAALQTMGCIDLDPASSTLANERVKAAQIYTIEDDGLSQPWFGRVWLNHPFGRRSNRAWVQKAITKCESSRVTEMCCITFACTSEQWFQPLLSYPQCFLFPRTNYLLPIGQPKTGVTKGSVVTYFGSNGQKFAEAFSGHGRVKIVF
jgi:hypothetical protein